MLRFEYFIQSRTHFIGSFINFVFLFILLLPEQNLHLMSILKVRDFLLIIPFKADKFTKVIE